VYSLSPGGILSWAPAYDLIAQVKEVGPYVNMYRVTNDDGTSGRTSRRRHLTQRTTLRG
jgi:hypothetical protein